MLLHHLSPGKRPLLAMTNTKENETDGLTVAIVPNAECGAGKHS